MGERGATQKTVIKDMATVDDIRGKQSHNTKESASIYNVCLWYATQVHTKTFIALIIILHESGDNT